MATEQQTPEQARTVSIAEFEALKARLAKADRRAEAAEERAATTEKERDAERARVTESRVSEALIHAASEAGIIDAEMMPKLIDRSEIQVADDGRARPASVKAAVAKFLADHPAFPTREPRPAAKGGTPPGPRRPTAPRQGSERTNHLGFPVDSVEAAMTERVLPFFM